MRDGGLIRKKGDADVVVALVGSPNVGKSTLFNALTGMRQHTGNWPGKTVSVTQGRYQYKGKGYLLVDLPGTYSLLSASKEEAVTMDFIRSGQADIVLVVTDATSLERTLLPALQVMELWENVAVCINLMDEAARKGIRIDAESVSRELGVPALGISAGRDEGLDALKETIRNLADGFLPVHRRRVLEGTDYDLFDWSQGRADQVTALFADRAQSITAVSTGGLRSWKESPADRIVLHKVGGPLLLLILLFGIFWLTIKGANYPSALLQLLFDRIKSVLLVWTGAWPRWLSGLLVDGVYHTMSCVVSVMLPPLLIFFPLFSLLEDLGYLPRAAFLLDHPFAVCGSCGKQALTMAMGFGCNAVGVMGTRIIASRKERLLSIVTNSLVPCNGRFPAMIVLIQVFFGENDLLAAGILTIYVLLGIAATMASSGILNKMLFAHESASMILELPSYRIPNLRKVLKQSLLDRVWSILKRAVLVSAPAGALIWIAAEVQVSGRTILETVAVWIDPIGRFLGMNGVILTAFLLAIPANELLLPSLLLILGYGAAASTEPAALGSILAANGWTVRTAICTILFLVFHWPCSTTCLTIQKETSSWKWTAVSILLPLMIGVFLCSFMAHL